MAKIWFLDSGEDLQTGKVRNWSLSICRSKLGLEADHWHGSAPPCFQPANDETRSDCEPRQVVIEVTPEEAEAQGWKSGFYLPRLSVKEAADRLGLIGG